MPGPASDRELCRISNPRRAAVGGEQLASRVEEAGGRLFHGRAAWRGSDCVGERGVGGDKRSGARSGRQSVVRRRLCEREEAGDESSRRRGEVQRLLCEAAQVGSGG